MRPALQELLRAVPRRSPDAAADVGRITALAKRLDAGLLEAGMRIPSRELWGAYRRAMAFFCLHGTLVGVVPVQPGTASTTATPRSNGTTGSMLTPRSGCTETASIGATRGCAEGVQQQQPGGTPAPQPARSGSSPLLPSPRATDPS